MGKKPASKSPSSSEANASDSADYVVVSPSEPVSWLDWDPPAGPPLEEIKVKMETAQREKAEDMLSKFSENPYDYYDGIDLFLCDLEDAVEVSTREDIPSYLVQVEELLEKSPELMWLMNVETRFLNHKQARVSWSIGTAIRMDVEPVCEKMGISAESLPEHTHEVLPALYNLGLNVYEKMEQGLPWSDAPVRRAKESMTSYLSSARRWIRGFISPGDTSPGNIQFIVVQLLKGLDDNFQSLKTTMEGALVKKRPQFETQNDAFIWFRQFRKPYKPRKARRRPNSISEAAAPSESVNMAILSVAPVAFDGRLGSPKIPVNYDDAITSENKSLWGRAMDHRVSLLEHMGVWTTVDQVPQKKKLLQADWSFNSREIASSQLFDAQLVARDSASMPSVNLSHKSVQSVSYETVRLMLALAVQHDWCIERIEIDAAMSYGAINREVYVRMPNGADFSSRFVRLNKTLDGLKEAPLVWYNLFCDIVEGLGFVAIKGTPGLFYNRQSNVRTFILLYVDDILVLSETQRQLDYVKSLLRKSLHLLDHGFPNSYLSLGITRLDDGGIRIDSRESTQQVLDKYAHLYRGRYNFSKLVPVLTSEMERAVRIETRNQGDQWKNAQEAADAELLSNSDLTWFRSAVGSLGSLVNKSRPDLANATSYLSTVMNRPNQLHWRMLMRLLSYLNKYFDTAISYKKQKCTELACYAVGLVNYSNISNTHCSAVWSYGDTGSKNENTIHWQSWNLNRGVNPYNALLNATKTALSHAAYLDDLLVAIHERQPGDGGVLFADLDTFPQLGNNRIVQKSMQERRMRLQLPGPHRNPAIRMCAPQSKERFNTEDDILEYS